MKPETVWFDGPCLFLTCLEEGGHSHPVCPTCRALRFGNLACPTCRSETAREIMRREEAALLAVLDKP